MSQSILESERAIWPEVRALVLEQLARCDTIAEATALVESMRQDVAIHEQRAKLTSETLRVAEYHLNRLRREAGEIQ